MNDSRIRNDDVDDGNTYSNRMVQQVVHVDNSRKVLSSGRTSESTLMVVHSSCSKVKTPAHGEGCAAVPKKGLCHSWPWLACMVVEYLST